MGMLRYSNVIQKVIKRFANDKSYDDKLDLENECYVALLEYADSVSSERDAYVKCRDAVKKYLYRKNGNKISETQFAKEVSLTIPDNQREADLATAFTTDIVRKLDFQIVLAALDKLDWWQKLIIEQMYLAGKTTAEIQQEFFPEWSESWVQNCATKGLQRVRNKLNKELKCQQK